MNGLNELAAALWAMEPRALGAFFHGLDGRLAVTGSPPMAAGISMARRTMQGAGYELHGGVAVVPITGIIFKEVPWIVDALGIAASSTLAIREALDAAVADSKAKAIILAVDSPGGVTDGMQELADAIFAARRKKAIGAFVQDLGASGAYWVASQADGLAANETARVGSIGVYAVLIDYSEQAKGLGVKVNVVSSGAYKGTGVVGAPVSDDQLGPIRELVDGMASIFVAHVARGRGVNESSIAALATGRTWLAAEAERLGLVDVVMNFDQAVAVAGGGPMPTRAGGSSADWKTRALEDYKATVKSLLAAGDPRPERTIAVDHPRLQERYLAAVNAKR